MKIDPNPWFRPYYESKFIGSIDFHSQVYWPQEQAEEVIAKAAMISALALTSDTWRSFNSYFDAKYEQPVKPKYKGISPF